MSRRTPPRAGELVHLAASLLAEDRPPASVHGAWRTELRDGADAGTDAAEPDAGRDPDEAPAYGPAVPTIAGPRSLRSAPMIAAAAVMFIAAVGIGSVFGGGDAGGGPSESTGGGGDAAAGDPAIALAAVAPAVDGAMGERDVSALRDPHRLEDCLSGHGEDASALLGAAPVTHEGRVRQLFVLTSGIPGRVSVLLVSDACGSEPGPPLVHGTIGAPG